MAASALPRLFALVALFCLLSVVNCSPDPNPQPAPFSGCCCCRPCCCYCPCCRCSTTSAGALLVPTMTTVHTKGCSKSCGGGGCGCCGCGCGGCGCGCGGCGCGCC